MEHTNHYEQDAKGRGMPRGTFTKTIPMMFDDNTTETNIISTRNKRNTNHDFDYIVDATRNSLDDQTAPTKVCSSHRYEQLKLMEEMMTQSC
jgi:hypothetical protein